MTADEANALVDELIERLRAFISEEVQNLHGAGRTVSSQEIVDMLKSFELNEMKDMFNSDRIPQDKFRVFLQRYLRLWFELFASRIAEAGDRVINVDNMGDLPDDGSSVLSIVDGDLYYWNGTEWIQACDKEKLAGIASGAEVNVQSDWTQTNNSADDYIKNKPVAATQTTTGLMSNTDKTKLDGIASGAEVNVQSDWTQTNNSADDYIKNKPVIPPELSADVAALQSISVIRGNVDTHAHLLALSTTNMRVNDAYIVEQDENNDDDSAIYTWDGTGWNFTHIWRVDIGTLNTNNATAQTPVSSESFAGEISLHKISKTGSYDDLNGKPAIPSAQVNSDWDAASGVSQILNKPSIPAAANNATLTIKQNDTSKGTFTADASTNVTVELTDTVYSDATPSAAGLMSSADKAKLDGIGTKYGTYTVSSTPFTFDGFAAKNENSESFDVLEVSFAGAAPDYSVEVSTASGNSGSVLVMIFNVPAGKTVVISPGFAFKLIDGGELTLAEGVHVVTLLRASTNIVNIAPYY
jgi:hypothetical protein